MDLSYYTFALFVFFLVCAGMWFFSKMYRRTKKDENNDYAKEQRLYKLYQNVEDMMNSFEEYIEESKVELDQKIAGFSAKFDQPNEPLKKEEGKQKSEESSHRENDQTVMTSDKSKINIEEQIKQFLDAGMDINEIAKRLGISSKQVSLIMDIKKIKTPKRR